jgi:hypothetical protein
VRVSCSQRPNTQRPRPRPRHRRTPPADCNAIVASFLPTPAGMSCTVCRSSDDRRQPAGVKRRRRLAPCLSASPDGRTYRPLRKGLRAVIKYNDSCQFICGVPLYWHSENKQQARLISYHTFAVFFYQSDRQFGTALFKDVKFSSPHYITTVGHVFAAKSTRW